MSWTAHVVTIFPTIFDGFLECGLLSKALARHLVEVRAVDLRDFTDDKHRTTDDAPYGGGAGMVMLVEPVVRAIESVGPVDRKVLLTPQGQRLTQSLLVELSRVSSMIIVCGRYEGVDERIRSHVDSEISIGDYVLNGGEVAAMALIDGVARLVPGVVGNPSSLVHESHAHQLLEHPQYTRPADFKGHQVPEVLLSGNHARIERWRRRQALIRTRSRRPDLWAEYHPSAEDLALLEEDD
jgi:tRNA (guanine37-N1)-methyltransferase